MDEYSSKKGIHGMPVPRKGTSHTFGDKSNNRHQSGPLCNHPSCSSRVNPPKVDQSRSSEKGIALKSSFQSSLRGKEVVRSSSITTNNPVKSLLIEPHKTLSSWLETESSKSSSIQEQDEQEILELIPQPKDLTKVQQSEVEDIESGRVMLMETGGSNLVSNTRSQRNFYKKFGLCSQENQINGPMTSVVTNNYGLGNLSCNFIFDVIPNGCSSSNPNHNTKKDMIKKRIREGESSSNAREKKMIGSSLEASSGSRNGISISDSRRSRNILPHRDISIASVRTQRLITTHGQGRISSQLNENNIIILESSIMIPHLPHSCFSYHNHTFVNTLLSRPSSYSRFGISSEWLCGVITVSPTQDGLSHSLINQDGFPRYNMDGIAEVSLALERVEHDGELTHQQILLLETNLLFNGLSFSDHHRDMRLDIDNMSYEELLALEDRMGTVSIALTEEALSDCLERSIYQSASLGDATKNCKEDKDDIKCCICQEEYVLQDEVGILQCQHKFHVVCIQQWMRLKNWCPICKVSAAPSISSSPH